MVGMKKIIILIVILFLVGGGLILVFNLNDGFNDYPVVNRENKIPSNAVKITPETDLNPPKSYSNEYHDPVPLPRPINTAGGEDSAFIRPDGKTLYFWFTPEVNADIHTQLKDGVTGIYSSNNLENTWTEPQRIWFHKPGKLSFDGCGFIKNNIIWTCAAREGYLGPEYSGGLCWFKGMLDPISNTVKNYERINFLDEWEVGELHIHENKLYYHSKRPGGKGGMDIWVLTKDNYENWTNPQNLNINTERDEGFPAISPNGNELWFSRDYAVWRSKKNNGTWLEPEKMFSPLAGEPSIDTHGNVYFTHHFFEGNNMIEADIYVAYKK
jgi:hypothetical protein